MRFVMFYHSLISDWNHGNAHFLRGIATELLFRGHDVAVYEPADSWSYANLTAACNEATGLFESRYPWLKSNRYKLDEIDLEAPDYHSHSSASHRVAVDLSRRASSLRAAIAWKA